MYKKVLPPQTHLDVVTLNLLIYYFSDVYCYSNVYQRVYSPTNSSETKVSPAIHTVAGKTKKKKRKTHYFIFP